MNACPFCGKRQVINDTLKTADGKTAKYRKVCGVCGVCGASTRWLDTEEAAADAWDIRAVPADAPAVKQADTRNDRGKNAVINRDLFLYQGDVYARNPWSAVCYRDMGREGYKRIKKAAYLLAYTELMKGVEKDHARKGKNK
jgi:transcription elongation factor Elf1